MTSFLCRFLILLASLVVFLAVAGILLFPRPPLPAPVTEDYCAAFGIRFDATSLEKIYLDPDGILADPQAFIQSDPAYRLLAESRLKGAEPFKFDTWLGKIEKLAAQPQEKREQQINPRLGRLILAHQQAFCQQVGQQVLAYLPPGSSLEVTLFLTALDEAVPAQSGDGAIAFSLSHPLIAYAAKLHEPTGLSAFFNLGLHELFHAGYSKSVKYPTLEEHQQNEVVIDMLIALQNEGIATHVSHELAEQYPSPFEWFLYLVDQKPVVRWYIDELNKLFGIAQTQPTGEAYDAIYRQIGDLGYRKKAFYIVGAYMAATIEQELGRQALIQTITEGHQAFADAYNRLSDEGMHIQWSTAP